MTDKDPAFSIGSSRATRLGSANTKEYSSNLGLDFVREFCAILSGTVVLFGNSGTMVVTVSSCYYMAYVFLL